MLLGFGNDLVVNRPSEHVLPGASHVQDSGIIIDSPIIDTGSAGTRWIAPRQGISYGARILHSQLKESFFE
jgi:hypothetical protein